MRVTMVHEADEGYGGGIMATRNLHFGLKQAGIDSKILCKYKKLESTDSVPFPQSKLLSKLEPRLQRVTSMLGLNDIHCLSTFRIKKEPAYVDADVIHIHGVHTGFFNYLALPYLTAEKPAILTLHDMWPFTGHCSYSYDCERFKIGCGRCPYPEIYPSIKRDNTRLEWKLKNWVYHNSNLTIIAPSHWLIECARQSMLAALPIHHIPYGINTDVYKPLDKYQYRELFGLPPKKNVLLFGAMRLNGMEGVRKGADLVIKALQSLPKTLKSQTSLLLLGQGGDRVSEAVGIDSVNLGYLGNERLKAIAYNTADLVLLPSRRDNLPLISMETISCGTPVVAFRVGGIPDVVRPQVTGYLAEPENVKDFNAGIVQLLEDQNLRQSMAQNCRTIALNEYSMEAHVDRHIELYRKIIKQRNALKN
jgi:glycosyltransferase involved in cell wall biosynthesis